jgi:hypothetical protein
MILSELSKTGWFQDNLDILTKTPHRNDDRVRHCIGLLAASKFKECSEICEQWLLASDEAKDLWRSGTPTAWMTNAYSFATTVAVITGAIVPKAQKQEEPSGTP